MRERKETSAPFFEFRMELCLVKQKALYLRQDASGASAVCGIENSRMYSGGRYE